MDPEFHCMHVSLILKVKSGKLIFCRYNICIWCYKQWEDTHDACEKTYITLSFHIFAFVTNVSYLILSLPLTLGAVQHVNLEKNVGN